MFLLKNIKVKDMKNRKLRIILIVLALALTGCNDEEGITFVKDPDKAGEPLTPPHWAAIARKDIQSGLAMTQFNALCKLLYREDRWFVGCTPRNNASLFLLYSVRQDKTSQKSAVVIALNDQAKKYAHQNLMLRQIITADTQPVSLEQARLKQDFEAQSGGWEKGRSLFSLGLPDHGPYSCLSLFLDRTERTSPAAG